MRVLVNYANGAYRKAQKWNTWTGKYIGGFDKVYEFTDKDIEESYYKAHKDILSVKRGNGLWLWKPYFIHRVLSDCKEGDIVFYLDSGAFFLRNIEQLISGLKPNEKIWVSDNPTLESCFTKEICFERMGCSDVEYRATNQIQATYIMFVCSTEARAFVDEWLRYCEDYDLISPDGGLGLTEDRGNRFVAHREDQSVLSLLCKKHGIKAHKDPSQRGKYPETFFNPHYTYCVPQHPEDTYKPFVFLHKSPTVSIMHISKMIVRTFISVHKVRRLEKKA